MSGIRTIMAALMVLSAISVSAGAVLLRIHSLVPVTLTYATALAVLIVAVTAYFVSRGSLRALNFGVILSVAAVISSISSAAHLSAMLRIFDGGLISILDLLEIMGFYVFPGLYIFLRVRMKNETLSVFFTK